VNQLTRQPTPEEPCPDRFSELLAQYLPFAIWGLCALESSERRAALVTLGRFIAGRDSGEEHHDS
jgi:hypothetical protein